MTSAQQAEEELQQSVVFSEEDMEGDELNTIDSADGHRAVSTTVDLPDSDDHSLRGGHARNQQPLDKCPRSYAETADTQADPEPSQSSPEDADADGDSNDAESSAGGNLQRTAWRDDSMHPRRSSVNNGEHASVSNHSPCSGSVTSAEDADDEAVGAVKIRPGDSDDDEEASHGSETDGTEDTDSAAAWEDAPDGDGEGDDDFEAAASNTCIFCKQDEDHDPGEDFEEILECSACGEYCKFLREDLLMTTLLTSGEAHRLCARQANAFSDDHGESRQCSINTFSNVNGFDTGLDSWRCPDCVPSETSSHQVDDDQMVCHTLPLEVYES